MKLTKESSNEENKRSFLQGRGQNLTPFLNSKQIK